MYYQSQNPPLLYDFAKKKTSEEVYFDYVEAWIPAHQSGVYATVHKNFKVLTLRAYISATVRDIKKIFEL